MPLYIVKAGAMPTTAAEAPIATGTAIKTLIQIGTPSTRPIKVVEWGISFDGTAANLPIRCELLETGAVAATVTAHVAAGVQPYNDSGAPASLMTLSTTTTGFNASAEGTITATRVFDAQLVAPSVGYFKQFPLGREPMVAVSRLLRVRVTAGTTVNAYPYIVFEE